jgi:transcription-repair coupling factor (superfamily II helicase)
VVVAPLLALVQRTLAPEQLTRARLRIQVGERVAQRTLLGRLVDGGYDPSVEVTGIGEFAHRGGLVDAWPPGSAEGRWPSRSLSGPANS